MTSPEARTAAAPLLHTVTVPQPPEAAFALFTGEFGRWWPLASHSVGGGRATGVRFGASAGAQIIETVAGAAPVTWGTVTVWDPPYRVAFSWHPGAPEPEAGHIEVTFARAGAHTEVTLRHTGWVNRPDGAAARERYARNWPVVLGAFVSWTPQAVRTGK